MQTIWFPAPVFILFRRLVNVVSTLSISHQYFLQQSAPSNATPPDVDNHSCAWKVVKSWRWPSWKREAVEARFSLAVDGDAGSSFQPPPRQSRRQTNPRPRNDGPLDVIHRLMRNPALYDPVRAPRHPVVLCHGLYGFDVRGPSAIPMLRTHYWSNVLAILRKKIGAEVIVTSVPPTGSITSRAQTLHEMLCKQAPGRSVNFMAHSMGGLDCRYLISHIKPTEYAPVSLTTVATPHQGSPFMDWCTANLGLGKLRRNEQLQALSDKIEDNARSSLDTHQIKPVESLKPSLPLSLASLPSSFTTLLLSLLDSPAYANLSTAYLTNVFNPNTPNDPRVRYFSVAGRLSSMNIWHPLWLPKMVLDGYEERQREHRGEDWQYEDGGARWGNDGLVTVQSAKWGEFLGILEECDHWELRGARGIELDLWGGATASAKEGDSRAGSDGWSLGDWSRFVRAWKKEEKEARDAGAQLSEREEKDQGFDRAGTQTLNESAKEKEKEQGIADEVVKASTEKLSAVFDWIIEQVPSRSSSPSSPAVAHASDSQAAEATADMTEKRPQIKSELATKADLERFYVALCRKLYDEGL